MKRFGVRLWDRRVNVTATSAASKTTWSVAYWVQMESGQRQPPGLSSWGDIVNALTPPPEREGSLEAALVLEGLFWSWTAEKKPIAVNLARQAIAARGDYRIPEQVIRDETNAQHKPRGKMKLQMPVDEELSGYGLNPHNWPRHLLVSYLCHVVQRLDLNPESETQPLVAWLAPRDPGGKAHLLAFSLVKGVD